MIKNIDFQPSNSSSASDPMHDLKFLTFFLPQFLLRYMGIVIIESTTRVYEDRNTFKSLNYLEKVPGTW